MEHRAFLHWRKQGSGPACSHSGTQGILQLKNTLARDWQRLLWNTKYSYTAEHKDTRLMTGRHSFRTGHSYTEEHKAQDWRHSYGTQGILTLKNIRLVTGDTLIEHRAFLQWRTKGSWLAELSHGTQGVLTLKHTRLRTEDTLMRHRAFLHWRTQGSWLVDTLMEHRAFLHW